MLDLAGNVREWCRDAWDKNAYSKQEGDSVDPVVEIKGEERRILRGGGWADSSEILRVAYRLWSPAWDRNSAVGFRVAACPLVRSPEGGAAVAGEEVFLTWR